MSRTDSNPDVSEHGSPNPEAGARGDQPNSLDVDTLVTKVVEQLTPRIEQMVQSQKDRRFSKFEKEFAALQSSLKAGLVDGGMEPEEADAEIAKRLAKTLPPAAIRTADPTSSGKKSPGTADPLAEFQRSLLEKLGLQEEDPDVVALNNRPYGSEAERYAELATIAAKRARSASPAGAVIPSGTTVRPDLEKQYREEMLAARGKGATLGREIRDKYREKGLDVDHLRW